MKKKRRRIDIMCSIMSVFVVLLCFVFGGVALRLDVNADDLTLDETPREITSFFNINAHNVYGVNKIYTTTGSSTTVQYEVDGWNNDIDGLRYFTCKPESMWFGLVSTEEENKYYLGPLNKDGTPIDNNTYNEPGYYVYANENLNLRGFTVSPAGSAQIKNSCTLQPVYGDNFWVLGDIKGADASGVTRATLGISDSDDGKYSTKITIKEAESAPENADLKDKVEKNKLDFSEKNPSGTTLEKYYKISRVTEAIEGYNSKPVSSGSLQTPVTLSLPISGMSGRGDIPYSVSVWQLAGNVVNDKVDFSHDKSKISYIYIRKSSMKVQTIP